MSADNGSNKTYLERLHDLKHAYPALRSFLDKVENRQDEGRRLVLQEYEERHNSNPECSAVPGRCALLTFDEGAVHHQPFGTPEGLQDHLKTPRPSTQCRLYILEDMEPQWINVLGEYLEVDPLVFGEQMNTWNFTDSKSIPARILPSMVEASKAFTLRYYEFRQLPEVNDIHVLTNQMTFAANRRRYESWRDVDVKEVKPEFRHAFVRRCASFWTSQTPKPESPSDESDEGDSGWDAVILVDPPFDAVKWPEGPLAFPSDGCAILKDPAKYKDRKELWGQRRWDTPGSVQLHRDISRPYHGGSRTLTAACSRVQNMSQTSTERNLSSPLDEIVYHWQNIAGPALIASARKQSVNSATFLLKYLATMWTNQLDLVLCGVAHSEYFSDDHQARLNLGHSSSNGDWRKTMASITETTADMNYMRRHVGHFQRAMLMNIERLGMIIGHIEFDATAPKAIRDAQKDFAAIQAKLKPLCDRVDGLSGVAQDLANLHSTFQSIEGGERGVRLSLFLVILFPMTLVAALYSMGDYAPGKEKFREYWKVTGPLVVVVAALSLWRWPQTYATEVKDWFKQNVPKAGPWVAKTMKWQIGAAKASHKRRTAAWKSKEVARQQDEATLGGKLAV